MKSLVEKEYLLEKFDGKGGWTYAVIPEVHPDKETPFGWVRVKGKIDFFEFDSTHLMPMGNGRLFLPVRAEIRKKIKKRAGDVVHIVLYRDDSKLRIPADLEECLKMEPKAHSSFQELTEGKQKELITWIYSSKKEETKADRIVKTIAKLLQGGSF